MKLPILLIIIILVISGCGYGTYKKLCVNLKGHIVSCDSLKKLK